MNMHNNLTVQILNMILELYLANLIHAMKAPKKLNHEVKEIENSRI